MWEYEHSVETTADRAALWGCWSDMASWPEWNDGIAEIQVEGPFEVGTAFAMTAPGEDEPVRMRLAEIVPGELFTDEMDGGEFVVRTVHRLDPAGEGRTRVVYRTEITGPAADEVGPRFGPAITADFPDVLAALVRRAEGPADEGADDRAPAS
jgi:polyketide cyclase/dehydrase/lipid transport protein